MTQNSNFKHSALFIAIAQGARIQVLDRGISPNHERREIWQEFPLEVLLNRVVIAINREIVWRIVPEVKPDVVRNMAVSYNNSLNDAYDPFNLQVVFDGETKKLKSAKVLEVKNV